MKKYSLPLILLCGGVVAARAQNTAFNYQGRLNDSSGPADGSFDLRFAVFDSPTGGAQVGGAITNLATSVESGLFSRKIVCCPGRWTTGPPPPTTREIGSARREPGSSPRVDRTWPPG
jgi:hypothetical protein